MVESLKPIEKCFDTRCTFCKKKNVADYFSVDDCFKVNCPRCGRYKITRSAKESQSVRDKRLTKQQLYNIKNHLAELPIPTIGYDTIEHFYNL